MQFQQVSSHKAFRTGEIRFPQFANKKYSTPGYIVQTRKGSVPCITCDHFDELIENLFGSEESVMLNLNFWDILENPSTEILSKYLEQFPSKSLASYLHLEKYPLFQTLRNVEFPHSTSHSNDKGMYADLEKGRFKVSHEEFTNQTFNLFKNAAFVAMYDTNIKCEVNGSFGSGKQVKRAKTSTEN